VSPHSPHSRPKTHTSEGLNHVFSNEEYLKLIESYIAHRRKELQRAGADPSTAYKSLTLEQIDMLNGNRLSPTDLDTLHEELAASYIKRRRRELKDEGIDPNVVYENWTPKQIELLNTVRTKTLCFFQKNLNGNTAPYIPEVNNFEKLEYSGQINGENIVMVFESVASSESTESDWIPTILVPNANIANEVEKVIERTDTEDVYLEIKIVESGGLKKAA